MTARRSPGALAPGLRTDSQLSARRDTLRRRRHSSALHGATVTEAPIHAIGFRQGKAVAERSRRQAETAWADAARARPRHPDRSPPPQSPQAGAGRTSWTDVASQTSARNAATGPVVSSAPASPPPSNSPATAADTNRVRRTQPRYVTVVRPSFPTASGQGPHPRLRPGARPGKEHGPGARAPGTLTCPPPGRSGRDRWGRSGA